MAIDIKKIIKTMIIWLSYYLSKVDKIEIGKYKLNDWYYYNQKA